MTAFGMPAPRRLSLPRVKFKRPRWPKGDRVCLSLAVLWSLVGAQNVGESPVLTALSWALSVLEARAWWRSRRDDDDGPSAT